MYVKHRRPGKRNVNLTQRSPTSFLPPVLGKLSCGKQKSNIRSGHLPRLKIETPHASPGILAINHETPLCHIWILPNKLKNSSLPHRLIEYLLFFIVKFKMKWLPALYPIKLFSDTNLMPFSVYRLL